MANLIEEIDQRQHRFLRLILVTFVMLLTLLTVRYVFGTVLSEYRLNARPVGFAVLATSIALLAVMCVAVLQLGLTAARASRDPRLKEALIDNELTKFNLARSWKAAFLGAVATPFLFLLLSSFHEVDDPLLVALSTANIGCGAFLISFYLKSGR